MARACQILPVVIALCAGCGAKTGLLIPELDAGFDAGFDAGIIECRDRRLRLTRRRAEVYFAIDSSGSMLETFEGMNADPVEESRWYLLRDALDGALEVHGEDLSAGALFFPDPTPEPMDDDACALNPGLDVPVRADNGRAIIAEFERRGAPVGGTPTAAALLAIRDAIAARGPAEVTRSVILANDGAPNCNPDPPIPPPMCFCTHPSADVCAMGRAQNCLDDDAAVAAVEALRADGIPVYVLGLTDPEVAPILGEVLDRMAVAGGRPRETGERRFYDIRNADELSATLTEITESVSRCTLYLDPGAEITDDEELTFGGRVIPRDPTHTDGWDFTNLEEGEITLFGSACEEVRDGASLQACVF